MTIHLPGRAAAAAEIAPDLARIMAEQAEREAAEVALHAKNKEALFDGLRLVGIAHVLVSFDGSGDSGQTPTGSVSACVGSGARNTARTVRSRASRVVMGRPCDRPPAVGRGSTPGCGQPGRSGRLWIRPGPGRWTTLDAATRLG